MAEPMTDIDEIATAIAAKIVSTMALIEAATEITHFRFNFDCAALGAYKRIEVEDQLRAWADASSKPIWIEFRQHPEPRLRHDQHVVCVSYRERH